MDKDKDNEFNWEFIFVIFALFVTVGFAFVVLLVLGGFLWLDMKEDWRGTEAWREKQKTDYANELQKRCERNLLKQKTLVKVIENGNIKVPPEFLVVEECGNLTPSDKPKE